MMINIIKSLTLDIIITISWIGSNSTASTEVVNKEHNSLPS